MRNHPFLHGPHIFMSTENAKFPVTQARERDAAVAELQGQGVAAVAHQGKYTEPENSLGFPMRSDSDLKTAMKMAHETGQESVFVSTGLGGKNALIYTHGANAGHFHPGEGAQVYPANSPPDDNYTTLPTGEHVASHIDFDQLHPLSALAAHLRS